MVNPIRQYRDNSGHSQESLARILNVSSRTVQHWERDGLPDNLTVIIPLALAMLEIQAAHSLTLLQHLKACPDGHKTLLTNGDEHRIVTVEVVKDGMQGKEFNAAYLEEYP